MQIWFAVTRVQMFHSIILSTTNKRKRVREQNERGQEWQLLRAIFLPVIRWAWLTIFPNLLNADRDLWVDGLGIWSARSCPPTPSSLGFQGRDAGRHLAPQQAEFGLRRGWGTRDAMQARRSCLGAMTTEPGVRREQWLGSLTPPRSLKLFSRANSHHSF